MTTITQAAQATPGQLKQINRFGSDAIEKVLGEFGLDNPGAQRVIEHGDEFAGAVRIAVLASLKDLSVSDKYKNEEVASTYGYLSGYKPKDVMWQSNHLRQLFSGVGFHDENAMRMAVIAGAEGLFAIPRWQTLAPTYNEAVGIVLAKLAKVYDGRFINYRADEMSPQNLREGKRKADFMTKLAETQNGYDILVVPAQFGLTHRGRSVRRVREVIRANEFGLGAFEVGIMLLTHPERLQHYDDLWIDCAGDEFKPSGEREFSHAPLFFFRDGRLKFVAHGVVNAYDGFGSASGFLPQ